MCVCTLFEWIQWEKQSKLFVWLTNWQSRILCLLMCHIWGYIWAVKITPDLTFLSWWPKCALWDFIIVVRQLHQKNTHSKFLITNLRLFLNVFFCLFVFCVFLRGDALGWLGSLFVVILLLLLLFVYFSLHVWVSFEVLLFPSTFFLSFFFFF